MARRALAAKLATVGARHSGAGRNPAFRFSRFLIACRKVSSASAAAESLFFEPPKKSNQKKGGPDVALAMKPRVRVGREEFLTVHPCTGKNARASMRAPLAGLISQPPPPQRGPQDQRPEQEPGNSGAAVPRFLVALAPPAPFASAYALALDLGSRHRAEQRSRARGKGANVRAHGCASLRRPETGEQRRVRRSRAMLGSPSLWLLSLGETRESDSAAAEADETLRRANAKRVKPEALDCGPRRNDDDQRPAPRQIQGHQT